MSDTFSKSQPGSRAGKFAPFRGFVENVFEPEPFKPERLQISIENAWESPVEKSEREANENRESAFRLRLEQLLEQSRKQAENILRQAQEQAQQIIAAAQRKSEEIEARAYQAGFEQGEVAGMKLGEQKNEPVIRNLKSIADTMLDERNSLLASQEEKLVEMAYLVALHVVHREIRTEPSPIIDVARHAVSKVRQATRLVILVSPHDYRHLQEHAHFFQSQGEAKPEISIKEDETITRGGCRIIADNGEIDATIQSMIEEIRARIWRDES